MAVSNPVAGTTITKTTSMTLEGWYMALQVMAVIATAVALLVGKFVNDRQSQQNAAQAERLLKLEADRDMQREKTAIAEKSLLDFQMWIKEPRTIEEKKAGEILGNRPPASVEISPLMNNPEASAFAKQLASVLRSHGWGVSDPGATLISSGVFPPGVRILMHGESPGAPIPPDQAPDAVRTLYDLLSEAVTGNPRVEIGTIREGLPVDGIAVVIGAKY